MKGKVPVLIIAMGGSDGGASLSGKHCKSMITFPAKALESHDESGAAASPEVGDKVTLPNVMATVKSVDGDNISVEVESVNGMPTTSADADGDNDSDAGAEGADPMHAQMQALAEKADGQ